MAQKSVFLTVALSMSCVLSMSSLVGTSYAQEWAGFRGPQGSGVQKAAKGLPAEFGEKKNLVWKFKMPGPGASCPIVVGDRVFVTCWTGYGTEGANSGKKEDLKRHLVCVDLSSGQEKWRSTVDAVLPEDTYASMMLEHGFASHTPVSDGKQVFAFFGKSGVYAYDLDGKELWNKSVGTKLNQRRWGSACSPILHKDLLIVLASAENDSLVALNKKDGKVAWEQNYQAFSGNWSTPLMAKVDDKKSDLVVAVSDEVWGLNPQNGKLRWYVSTEGGGGGFGRGQTISSSFAYDGETIVHVGGRSGKSTAFKAGGSDDIEKSHVVWSNGSTGGHSSPVLHDGLVYSVARRVLNCMDAKSGEKIYQERLPTVKREGASSGGGRRRGGDDYASPVIGDGKLFYVTRKGDIHVFQVGREAKLLASNRFEGDNGDFSATPAITKDRILIRSSNYLYCVGTK